LKNNGPSGGNTKAGTKVESNNENKFTIATLEVRQKKKGSGSADDWICIAERVITRLRRTKSSIPAEPGNFRVETSMRTSDCEGGE